MTKIIATLRDDDDFDRALFCSCDTLFELSPNILTLGYEIKQAHKYNKKLYIHMDLAKGIADDKYGILYAKELGVDGIISTRTHTIKMAHEAGLKTVQRFFVADSHFVETAFEAVRASNADMIEIMPGTATKIISRLKEMIDIPIIAGGLIETADEVDTAIAGGAFAVSSGSVELWDL